MTDLWKELREKNIGGSDIAALFGESPYEGQTYYSLYHQKRGDLVAPDLDGNARAEAGRYLEAGIIEWANKKWGFDFYQPKIYVEHSYVQGMGCTPDAYSASDKNLMAQIKNVDSMQFANKWEYEGETITKAPLHIMLQVQHEMECTGRARSYLIVCVGGNRLFSMLVEHDPEVALILRQAVIKFWIRTTPPEPDFKRDKETIKTLKSRLAIAEVDETNDPEIQAAMNDYFIIKNYVKKLEDDLEVAEAKLFYLLDPAKSVKCGKMRAKFRRVENKPDRVITPDMVGQKIPGRKGYISINVLTEESPF